METASRGRVLVVEDDAARRAADVEVLERAGFRTQSTSSPSEALTFATEQSFDLVVCDLDIPTMAGLALLRRLQERGTAAAFLLLCSEPSNELVVQAAEVGVVQFLLKPVKAALLERAVAAGVDRNRQVLSVLKMIMSTSASPRSVPATDAKNEFGSVLEAAVHEGAVIITKHDAPRAVLVSIDRISEVLARHEPNLHALTQEFDALVARMRTPKARAAARGLFTATSKELGEAARAGSTKRRG